MNQLSVRFRSLTLLPATSNLHKVFFLFACLFSTRSPVKQYDSASYIYLSPTSSIKKPWSFLDPLISWLSRLTKIYFTSASQILKEWKCYRFVLFCPAPLLWWCHSLRRSCSVFNIWVGGLESEVFLSAQQQYWKVREPIEKSLNVVAILSQSNWIPAFHYTHQKDLNRNRVNLPFLLAFLWSLGKLSPGCHYPD